MQTARSRAVRGVGSSPFPPFARDLHISTHCVESTLQGCCCIKALERQDFAVKPRASFVSFNRTILVKLPDNSNICVIAESAPMLALSLPTVFSCLLARLVTFY